MSEKIFKLVMIMLSLVLFLSEAKAEATSYNEISISLIDAAKEASRLKAGMLAERNRRHFEEIHEERAVILNNDGEFEIAAHQSAR